MSRVLKLAQMPISQSRYPTSESINPSALFLLMVQSVLAPHQKA